MAKDILVPEGFYDFGDYLASYAALSSWRASGFSRFRIHLLAVHAAVHWDARVLLVTIIA